MTEVAIEPVDIALADALAGIPHGFLGRRGGYSAGLVATLNVGFGADDPRDTVTANRARAVDAVLPGARLVTVHQVHSAEARVVDEPWSEDNRPQADGVVTDRPGLVLGIVTADCAPVLFADRAAGVIGAAHAGWRGAHGGVLEATLAAMATLGGDPARTVAAIGPTIGPASYEVDAAFRERFVSEDALNERFFAPGKAGHAWFDLPAYIAARLRRAGVGEVEDTALDTYPAEDRFYSFRRTTHRGEPTYGRQFSLIGLPV